MLEGNTTSGFRYEISEERLDDYALIKTLQAWRDGDILAFFRLPELLLGPEGAAALEAHCRGENGKVSKKAVTAEILEFLNLKPVKN